MGRWAPCSGCVRVAGCGRWWGVFCGWVRGLRVRLVGRVGEARVAGPGGACDGGRVWAASWVAGGEGQGRRLCGGVFCVGVCVPLQRCACAVSCRPGGSEEKLAVFCGRGKDSAEEHAYFVQLLVRRGCASSGLRPTRRMTLWMALYPQVRECCGLGGGSFRMSGPAPIWVWAVQMAQIQGTVPLDGQRRWIHWARQSMASPTW